MYQWWLLQYSLINYACNQVNGATAKHCLYTTVTLVWDSQGWLLQYSLINYACNQALLLVKGATALSIVYTTVTLVWGSHMYALTLYKQCISLYYHTIYSHANGLNTSHH